MQPAWPMNEQACQWIAHDLELAGLSLEQEQLLERLEGRRITADKELPQMDFLFRLFHKPCFPRGELVALSGKAKSGKTFVASILMALCLRSRVLSLERIEQKRLHVLWYDTEQSEESTQDILCHRIMPMVQAEVPEGMIDIFNVRGELYSDRLPMLELAVRHYRPDLVIVDGIRDFVADINDGVVAQDTIERLMRLASEVRCSIVCVLHQNKSSEDRNLRGWIGTELKNKAFEVYECAKSSERIFTLAQVDTRKYDIGQQLKFAVNEEGIPYLCTEEQLLEAQYNAQLKTAEEMLRQGGTRRLAPFNPKYVKGKEQHKTVFDLPALFAACMVAGRTYSEAELHSAVGMEANIATAKVLTEQIDKAVAERIILQSYDGSQKRIYVRPVVQTELPFDDPAPR